MIRLNDHTVKQDGGSVKQDGGAKTTRHKVNWGVQGVISNNN